MKDDEDGVYTGRCKATLGNGQRVNVEIDSNAEWRESGKESSHLSKEIRMLIVSYSE